MGQIIGRTLKSGKIGKKYWINITYWCIHEWVKTLYKVTMPLSVPGVVSGITMVFMPSVTTFFIPRVLGGGYTMMFGDLIEAKFLTEGNWNAGSALSLLMMLLILVSLSILRKADPNGEGGGIA